MAFELTKALSPAEEVKETVQGRGRKRSGDPGWGMPS